MRQHIFQKYGVWRDSLSTATKNLHFDSNEIHFFYVKFQKQVMGELRVCIYLIRRYVLLCFLASRCFALFHSHVELTESIQRYDDSIIRKTMIRHNKWDFVLNWESPVYEDLSSDRVLIHEYLISVIYFLFF